MACQPCLVTIVTPSYNSAQFIEETILSIKNQTYPHIEHIIMDGGSTDNTLDVIRKYEGTYNLRWVSQPDEGQSDAINKGWRQASGAVLCWLNSDDVYLPSAVAAAVRFLEDNPEISLLYGDCNTIDEHGGVTGKYPASDFSLKRILCQENMVPQPAAFWRREVLDKVGFLDVELYYTMDLDYWIRTSLAGLSLKYSPQLLANFRVYPQTKTESGGYKAALERLAITDKVFSGANPGKEVSAFKGRAYAYAHYLIGVNYHMQAQMKSARAHLFRSLKYHPQNIFNVSLMGHLITSFFGRGLLEALIRYKSRLT
ncbi:glycosyltransferase family 2 protein [Chloroflexota bacterium]